MMIVRGTNERVFNVTVKRFGDSKYFQLRFTDETKPQNLKFHDAQQANHTRPNPKEPLQIIRNH